MPVVGEVRQPQGRAFALRDPLPWKDLSAIVRASEGAGYAALFVPEIAGRRDAFVTLGALATETRDLLLCTGVVPMRSRLPLLTAMAAATVQERSGGRLILGLGAGDAGRGALGGLRGTVAQVRALLSGASVEIGGESVRLSLVPASPPPIWVAALGPNAMRLAGEVADGALLNWCRPDRVSFARERIREGAEAAGRDPDGCTVAVYVRASVGDDQSVAVSALRAAAGQYASYPAYARQFVQMGLGEEAAAAAAAHRGGRPEDVPEELVRAVCVVGGGASERLEAYRAAGADLVVVYPVAVRDAATSIERTLLVLAPL